MASSEQSIPRPFRFSLQSVAAGSRKEWIDLVKQVDGAGFDMLVTADHLGGAMSPLVPLAVAAGVSSRLRLGVMVLNNDFHHPSLLARDATTLDLLSDGRVELGIGAGHSLPEYQRAGITFDPAPVRISRVEESVVLLRRLLDGETVTYSGDYFQLTEERCDPLPLQPHLPILVGGSGRRVHQIGARHGDAVGFTGLGRTLPDGQRHDASRFHPDRVDEDVRAVRIAAATRIGAIELQVLVQAVLITGDAHREAEEMASHRFPLLSPDDILATPYLMIGSVEEIAERLMAHRERWGFSHYTVRTDALGTIEPVIAKLSGR